MSDWLTADEWFADWLARLDRDGSRRRGLWRERVVLPVRDQLAYDYSVKTEQLRRMLAVEGQKDSAA